uniref:FDF domain-containing protein n=1 Tax=Corethron hystrix TaxID=216773 RepID=A0A7S1FVT0_9STRA
MFGGCNSRALRGPPPAPDQREPPPADPAILSSSAPPDLVKDTEKKDASPKPQSSPSPPPSRSASESRTERPKQRQADKGNYNGGKYVEGPKKNDGTDDGGTTREKYSGNNRNGERPQNRRPRRNPNAPHIGTGASLLNRKARGAVSGKDVPEVGNDFDFQSSAAEFDKTATEDVDPVFEISENAYQKDEFFDSISCDITDRLNGVNNRLRGVEERQLNTATFGAVSLNNRRGGRYRNGPSGGGRGRGRGGRGRGGYMRNGNMQRENNRWRRGPHENSRQATTSTDR